MNTEFITEEHVYEFFSLPVMASQFETKRSNYSKGQRSA